MKIKTSELIDAALDWAVDKAEGRIRPDGGYYCGHHGRVSRWSTDWAQGGPIIEREKISIRQWTNVPVVHAYMPQDGAQWSEDAQSPLIAAMRCYVGSKLGDEVEVPDDLTQAVTIPNYPRPEVKAFGERVNAAMYDASIRHSLGGLGGCQDFRIEDFDEDVRPYILAYLEGDLDSVAITYAAMRTKELELT